MPVDIFGRTDVKTSQRTVSGGVTLSQMNNTFLRRDGETTADGDINFNAHKLINVKDPVDAQDAATRSYVDTTKVSKFGDIITGDLKLLLNNDNIRTFGIGDITNGKSVSLLLGDTLNQIRHNFGHALKIAAANGVKFACPAGEVCRMGTHNSKDIQMNDNSITGLHDPTSPQDAATKAYVDTTALLKSALKTATGTIPATTYADTVIASFPTGKTMLNGKIFVHELWVERNSSEWFSTSCPTFFDNWPNFHKFTRNGTSLLAYYTSFPSDWTRNYRLDYIELP